MCRKSIKEFAFLTVRNEISGQAIHSIGGGGCYYGAAIHRIAKFGRLLPLNLPFDRCDRVVCIRNGF